MLAGFFTVAFPREREITSGGPAAYLVSPNSSLLAPRESHAIPSCAPPAVLVACSPTPSPLPFSSFSHHLLDSSPLVPSHPSEIVRREIDRSELFSVGNETKSSRLNEINGSAATPVEAIRGVEGCGKGTREDVLSLILDAHFFSFLWPSVPFFPPVECPLP